MKLAGVSGFESFNRRAEERGYMGMGSRNLVESAYAKCSDRTTRDS